MRASLSSGFEPEASKSSALRSRSCFFQLVIWTGLRLYFAPSWERVSLSLRASIATLDLKAALCLRRAFELLLMVVNYLFTTPDLNLTTCPKIEEYYRRAKGEARRKRIRSHSAC